MILRILKIAALLLALAPAPIAFAAGPADGQMTFGDVMHLGQEGKLKTIVVLGERQAVVETKEGARAAATMPLKTESSIKVCAPTAASAQPSSGRT